MIYLNEYDHYAAAWLRELMAAGIIPKGHVDERSIAEVTPDDLRGYSQCHFFAGIGMWPIALSLAGWPEDREVWTGSCPCQPFSSAGKQKGKADARHLWPEFHRLIRARRPVCVFGEQVPSAIRHGWWDDLCDDVEADGYATRSCDLPACSVGSPTIRQRLFWACWLPGPACRGFGELRHTAHAGSCGHVDGSGEDCRASPERLGESSRSGLQGHAGHGHDRHEPGRLDSQPLRSTAAPGGNGGRMENTKGAVPPSVREAHERPTRPSGPATSGHNGFRLPGSAGTTSERGTGGLSETEAGERGTNGPEHGNRPERLEHGRYDLASLHWLDFLDGKTRPIESGLECLVDGHPFRGADGRTGRARQSRTKILKAIGNAIHPEVGAAFIKGWMNLTLPE